MSKLDDDRVDWGRLALQLFVTGPARKLALIFVTMSIGIPLAGLAWWFRDSIAPTLGISDDTATNLIGAMLFGIPVIIVWLRFLMR